MYLPRWRAYLAIRVITGRYLAHRTASIVSERATKPGATTVIDHCLLLRRALILCIILRFFMRLKLAVANREVLFCLWRFFIFYVSHWLDRFHMSSPRFCSNVRLFIMPLVLQTLSLNFTSYLLHVNDRELRYIYRSLLSSISLMIFS